MGDGRTAWPASSAVPLPRQVDAFLDPVLLSIGISLVVLVLVLTSRPVVDRRVRAAPADASERARDIVAGTAPARSTTSPCAATSSGSSRRQPRRLRRPRRHLPGFARPDRPGCRARAGVVGVPALRRRARLVARGAGRGRGLAADLPRVGDARPLHRRRGGRRRAPLHPRGGQHKGLRQAVNRIASPATPIIVPRPGQPRTGRCRASCAS